MGKMKHKPCCKKMLLKVVDQLKLDREHRLKCSYEANYGWGVRMAMQDNIERVEGMIKKKTAVGKPTTKKTELDYELGKMLYDITDSLLNFFHTVTLTKTRKGKNVLSIGGSFYSDRDPIAVECFQNNVENLRKQLNEMRTVITKRRAPEPKCPTCKRPTK